MTMTIIEKINELAAVLRPLAKPEGPWEHGDSFRVFPPFGSGVNPAEMLEVCEHFGVQADGGEYPKAWVEIGPVLVHIQAKLPDTRPAPTPNAMDLLREAAQRERAQ